MVHLHSGILHSRKKEEAPTLHNSMDGTGKYYAKWYKPDGEREIPYDLNYKWNLINKANKWAKRNQKRGNKKQTDSDQRGGGKGVTGKEGKRSRNMYKGTMDKDNGGVRTEFGRGGVGKAGESNGRKKGTNVIEQQ